MPSAVASVNLTGNTKSQSGSLRPNDQIAPKGMYIVSGYISVTTVGVGASLTPSITYNDGTLSRTLNCSVIDASAQNYGSFSKTIVSDGHDDISWSVTLTGSAIYNIVITLEKIS
jgi:hypothetical protein